MSSALAALFVLTCLLPIASLPVAAGTPATTYLCQFTTANPANIIDGGWSLVPINIFQGLTISRLDVTLGITHAQVADLNIWLVTPGGAWNALVIGGAPNPQPSTTINNIAGMPGLTTAGVWTLRVLDANPNGFTGTVDYWTMTVYYSLGSNIFTPAVGATVSGNYLASVTATNAVSGRLFVDGGWMSDLTWNGATSRWEYTLDTKAFPDGLHTVTAAMRDFQGNEVSDGHSVTFDNWNVAVTFANPPAGASISGNYAVTATVPVDGSAVKGELYVDTELVGVDTTIAGGQYSISVDTTAFPDGDYNLRWVVYDKDGNSAVAVRTTTVNNYAITCAIASPAGGSQQTGNINVNANVPNYAVLGELYVDGVLTGTDTTVAGGQFSILLATANYPDGTHVLSIIAYDPDGASAVSTVSVKFENYNILANIVAPGTGSTLSGTWTVWLQTSSYAARGEMFVDDGLNAVSTTCQNFGGLFYYSFSLVTTNFRDGNHRVTGVAYDSFGSPAASTVNYIFNNYAISVAMTSPGINAVVSGSLTVTATVPGYTVRSEFYLDDKLLGVDTTSPPPGGAHSLQFSTTAYRDGIHTVKVIAYDPDGNSAVATRQFTIDNYAISTVITSPASGAIISGSASITATVPAYAVKGELLVDGSLTQTTSTQVSGAYDFTVDTTRYPDGKHTFTVVAYDPDGNSAASTISATVDNFNIFCSIVFPATGSTLNAATTVWANVPSYAVRGEMYVDGELYASSTTLSNFGGNFYYGLTLTISNFADGSHRTSVRAYDPDGNYAASNVLLNFDSYQIYAAIPSPAEGATVSGGSVTVRVQVPSYATSCELYIDGSLVTTTTTQSGGEFTPTFNSLAFADGKHVLSVKVYDPDGNYAGASRGITVDNYNVVVTFIAPGNPFSISGNAYPVNVQAPNYATRGELYVDDAMHSVDLTRDALNRFQFTLDTTRYADGNHRLRAVAYDPDGNSGTATVGGVFNNYDITAAFVSPPAGGSISGTATVTVNVPAYAVRGELYLDGLLVATDTSVTGGQFSFQFGTTAFPDGNVALTVKVVDPDGNFAADTRTVVIDNYLISCVIVAPASGATINGIYTVRATVPSYAARGELYVDGLLFASTTTQISGEFRFSFNTSLYKDGTHTLMVNAYDPDGNAASRSVSALIDNYQLSAFLSFSAGSPLSGTGVIVYAFTQNYSTRAEFYINDALVSTQTTKTSLGGGWVYYTHTLDTTRYPDGNYRIKILVYDPDGNSAVATQMMAFDNWKVSATFLNLPATIYGTQQVSVTVPSYATRAELYVDGTLLATTGTQVSGAFVFSLDTKAYRDGIHSLMVKVFDPDGNYAVDSRAVTVDNYQISAVITQPLVNNPPAISGTYSVIASVPSYTTKGELYVDGNLATTKTNSGATSITFSLDTKLYKDGSHTLMVLSYDPEGNVASASVTTTIDNWNVFVFLTVSYTPLVYSFTATARVPVYATSGNFYIDGNLVSSTSTKTQIGANYYFTYTMDPRTLRDGYHKFGVVTYDPDGNAASAESVVAIDNWQVSVSITAPSAGTTRAGSVYVNATASSYATKGELYVDGAFNALSSVTGGRYSFLLDTRSLRDGWHSIGVRAYDPDGESVFLSISMQSDNTAPVLTNVTVLYPQGQNAVKKLDYVTVLAQSTDSGSGLSGVWCDPSNIGGVNVQMLDDGLHNDSSFGDTVFGSGGIKVDSTMGYHFAFITSTDKAGNSATASAKIGVDTHDPLITASYVIYPIGQTAAKLKDTVRVVSKVIDTKMTVDTVLVMDTSGSMTGTPLSDAKTAAKTFIGMMGENDRVAIYSFHNPNPGTKPKQELAFTSDKTTANNTITNLGANDWTPLYDTIYDAIQYAKTSPNMPVVIAMTDGNDVIGYDNSGNELHSTHTLKDCKNASIPVYMIGLDPTRPGDPPINETVLKEIAYSSDGGSYYHAPSSSDLKAIFEDLARIVDMMDVGGIEVVYTDAQPVGGPAYVRMYDDGNHDDLAVGDGYFGSEYITIGTASTASIGVTVTALDVASNKDTDVAYVACDNTPPTLSALTPKYKVNQWWASDGDSIYFVANVVDTGAVSGLRSVELDASSIGGPAAVVMKDDGKGNDAKAGDGNFSSASVVVATGSATRFFTYKVTAYDNASNAAIQSGNVFIDNGRPLTANITSPLAGQYVEGLLTVRVQATDRQAIDRIDILLAPGGSVTQTAYNGLTGYYEYLLDSTAHADGSYSLCATGKDIAGYAFQGGSVISFFIDNHAPVLRFNSPRNGDYLSGIVDINTSGTSDVFLLAVEYSVDDGDFTPANTPWDTNNISDGTHAVKVRATDRAGHSSSATVRVVVDNTNPTCRIITPGEMDLLEGKVTVMIKASDAVGVTGVTISGAVSGEAEYNFLSGYYEYILDTRELPDGNYTLGAVSGDDFGHVTTAAEVNFRIDNHAPTLVVDAPLAYEYVSGMVLVSLNSSDGPFTSEMQVEYKVDERSWQALTGVETVWTALWNTSAFSDGSHTVSIRARDIIGNIVSQSLQVTVDNHNPLCQIYAPVDNQYLEGRQVFQVLAQDEVGIVNVTLNISGIGNYLMSFNGYTGYYEYTLMSTNLRDGRYEASVRTLDRSGKATLAGPLAFNVANVPPTFILVRPREGDAISDTISVEIQWTGGGGRAAAPNATVKYRIDNGAWIPAEQNTSTSALNDGTHVITVRATDPAGHSTDISVSVFIDKNYPQLTVLSPRNSIHITDSTPLKLRVKDEAGVRNVNVTIGNNTPEEIFINAATGFYESNVDLAGMPDGPYQVYVAAYDVSGHPTYANITVVLDTQGPQISLEQPALAGEKRGRIKFVAQAGDTSEVSRVNIRLRGGELRQMIRDASGNFVYSWDTAVSDDGTNLVEILAQDRLGNEASYSYELTIRNKVPNYLEDNFPWLLLLVLIIGFVCLTIAVVASRPRKYQPVQVLPAEIKPRVPPHPMDEEVAFEDDEEEAFVEDAPAPVPAPRSVTGTVHAPQAAIKPIPPAAAPPVKSSWFSKPAAPARPPADEFIEIEDDGGVETVDMGSAYMPRNSLPAASEVPKSTTPMASRPGVTGYTSSPAAPPVKAPNFTQAPAQKYQPPAPRAPVSAPKQTDAWEEEDEVAFEDDAPAQKMAYTPPKQQVSSPFGRPKQGISPLDALNLANLSVKRSDDEKKKPPASQPLGWTHARPADAIAQQTAQQTAPASSGKMSRSDEVAVPQSAMKSVPAGAGSRDKMGSMLDDLLTKKK